MLSPVWRATLCGDFEEGSTQSLLFDEDEAQFIPILLDLCCGTAIHWNQDLTLLIHMCKIADRYQIEPVQNALEDIVVNNLTAENCGSVWMEILGSGLKLVESGCRQTAAKQFQDFCRSPLGLFAINEDLLDSLLEDDELEVENEEFVLEALVSWMRDAPARRCDRLLHKVRFPWMERGFLERHIRQVYKDLPNRDAIVEEALALRAAAPEQRAALPRQRLAPCALRPRRRHAEPDWGRPEHRLAVGRFPHSVALDCRHAHLGLGGGVQVRSRATLEAGRALRVSEGEAGRPVDALAVYSGLFAELTSNELKA